MNTNPTDASAPFTQDDAVALILQQLNTATGRDSHHSFPPIAAAVTGIRRAALADFAQPLPREQRDRLHLAVQAAHSAMANQVSAPMRYPLSRMFWGVHFLINTWSSRSPDAVPAEGVYLSASALAKALEVFVEYALIWVCIDRLDRDVATGRAKLFTSMLDVSGVGADKEGEA